MNCLLTVSEDFAVDEDESEHDPQDPIQSSFLPLDIAQHRSGRRALVVVVAISVGVPFAQDAPERFLLAVAGFVLIGTLLREGKGEVRVPVRLDVSEEGEGDDRPDDVRFRLRCRLVVTVFSKRGLASVR